MDAKKIERVALAIAAFFVLAYTAYFAWFTVARHQKLNSSRFDLGNVEQTIWATTRGNFMHLTNPYGEEAAKRMAFHADFFLLALVPVYAVWPFTETLLILQTLAIASGGLATFLIARKIIQRPWLATALAAAYLLNPGLQWTNIFDVHAVAFAPPLILWAAWSSLNKRYGWTLVLAALAMTTKEEIGLMVAALGVYVWWRQRERRWGPWLTFGPLAWSVVVTLVTIPAWQAMLDQPPPVFTSYFGDSAADIVKQLILQPWRLLPVLFSETAIKYLWQLTAPFGLLPFGGLWSLVSAVDIKINLISTKPAQHLLTSHYTAGIIPWLTLGSIWTARWIVRRWANHRWWPAGALWWLVMWVGYAAYMYGPLPGTRNDHTRFATWRNEYAAVVRDWSKRIPSSAAVSVTNNIGSQFARRMELYSFPLGVDRADYIVIFERHGTPVVATEEEVTEQAAARRADPRYEVVEYRGDLTVLRRSR